MKVKKIIGYILMSPIYLIAIPFILVIILVHLVIGIVLFPMFIHNWLIKDSNFKEAWEEYINLVITF